MKQLFHCICYLLLASVSFSQSPARDTSSRPPVQAGADSVKILLALCNENFESQQYGEARRYAFQLLHIREAQGDKKGTANTLNFIGNSFIHQSDYSNAIKNWLPALQLKDELKDPLAHDVVENIGVAYYMQALYTDALPYFERLLQISTQSGDKALQARSHLFIGRCYQYMGKFKESLEAYQQCLHLNEMLKASVSIAVVLNNIGNTYNLQGNYPKAIEYILRSLKLSEQINNTETIVANLNDITLILKANNDDSLALNYLFRSKKIMESRNNPYTLAVLLGSISSIYIHKKDYAHASPYISQSLQLARKEGFMDIIISQLTNLGELNTARQKYAPALNAYYESLRLASNTQDKALTAINYTGLGKTYLLMAKDSARNGWPDSTRSYSKENLLRKARAYLERSVQLSKTLKRTDYLQDNYLLLSEVKAVSHDYDEAIKNFSTYLSYRDTLLNSDTVKALTQKIMQYEFDKKEAEKDKQRAIAQEKDKARVRQILTIAIGLILLGALLYYFNRKAVNARHKMQIARARQEVLLNEVNEHFMGNTMMVIDNFVHNNDKESASKYLMAFFRLFRGALSNASKKLVPIQEDLALLTNYLELQQLQFIEGPLEYVIHVDEGIDVDETLIPPMVFQVLAENAILHAFTKTRGGKITIRIVRKGNLIQGSVQDNGIGREAARRLRSTSYKAGLNNRESMGGRLAEELVKTAGRPTSYQITDLYNENNVATGTLVTFTLPYLNQD